MEITYHTYLIVLPLIFFAGFIDAIAGGGGLISLPAYMAAGLPTHYALGNNKFSSVWGTSLAASRYLKHNYVEIPVALLSACFALCGSALGTRTVLLLDPGFLRWLLLILIPAIAVFTFLKKDFGAVDTAHRHSQAKKMSTAAIAGFIIGFYDGFFGPGTGSFLILFFTLFLHYDFVRANANTKIVNLASNIAAVVTFIGHGKIIYKLGIPAAACGMAGNYLGSKLIIKNGARLIRPVFILVLTGLFVKIVSDILH